MSSIKLNINGIEQIVKDIDPNTPLLWVIRDSVGLVGTKYGCGIGQCGSCTVHIDSKPVRSCSFPVNKAQGKSITTVEGLAQGDTLSALQQAWIDLDVAQCGYCQAGQLMSATALLDSNPNPSDQEIDKAMAGNLCRCGTYKRIKAAIQRASDSGVAVAYYTPQGEV